MKRFICIVALVSQMPLSWTQQPVNTRPIQQFFLQSSAVVKEDGAQLSTPGHKSPAFWFPVKVPSTVLSALVANHVYPDPYTGMNNMLIPDASDSFNHVYGLEKFSHLPNEPNPWKNPYWYRTEFPVPASEKGKFFQLLFKGINYRAEVWLNGKQIADSSQMAGMFAEYAFDVSREIIAGSVNGLAVKIFPLDVPGLPAQPQLRALDDFFANGGPDGDIGNNITMLSSVGWDWIPEVHDRNIGIWQPVYLRSSGPVTIEYPKIVTELPNLPDTGIARLQVQCKITNHLERPFTGQISITIRPETFRGTPVKFSRPISLAAGESRNLNFSADEVRELLIRQPHLWWPNNYGRPDLYGMEIRLVNGNEITDQTALLFGIRTVASSTLLVDKWVRRDFFVNGVRIHLVGGAWVPDMMLNRDERRYDQELRLCRNGNVNLVRVWGGGLGETDAFYNAADRYGLLVWQDFWVTGDTHGEFKGSAGNPPRGDIFVRNVISTILRIRNHPSLLVWTGGNEGHARKELYDAMRNNVASLDGTRPFIPSSSGFARLQAGWDGSWPDNQPSGVYSGGPYSWQDVHEYFRLVNAGRDWLFKDETGLPSQPPFSSMKKIVPNLVPDTLLPFPLNNTWGYHDACTGNGHYETYYKAMTERYGPAASIREYCDKMQLLNADAYRGIFEAAGHRLNETGGVMLWKLNAAFPSVVWQVYDWFLEPNAGYYFMQRACEPVHIQLNADDSTIAIVNRSVRGRKNYIAEVFLYNKEGRRIYQHSEQTAVDGIGAFTIFPVAGQLKKENGLLFVFLRLTDRAGNTVSENNYWMHPQQQFRELAEMKPSAVVCRQIQLQQKGSEYRWTIQITNPGDQLAFFVNLQLMAGEEELMPAYWSENYISLLPGETKTLTVACSLNQPASENPVLRFSGANVPLGEVRLPVH